MFGSPTQSTMLVCLVGLPDQADEAIRDALSRRTCHIETYSDAKSALRRARARTPDVVVTELLTGAVDGLELIRAVREADSTVPVVALSLRAPIRRSLLYLVMAERLGAAHSMSRPLDLPKLVRWVEDAVETRSGSRSARDPEPSCPEREGR